MARNTNYRPPFVWFGGKSPVADAAWQALGDVDNYVEPFFGSGAVLFLRNGIGKIETVNDCDGFVSNFWRALSKDADAVTEAADWPVNEADLHARHLWLVGNRKRITERLMGDPEFFDARAAGWWVWGLNCWIGSGWCSGTGPWIAEDGELRQLPHLRDTGQGVNRKLPHLGNTGKGDCAVRRAWLRNYLREFSDRLRNVRVCCGDWSRVCGPSVTFRHGLTGVFLDPPYSVERTEGVYACDSNDVAVEVRQWAIENGHNDGMRIVLAGYAGEHDMPKDWRVHAWKAAGGYGLEGNQAGRENSVRERLWMSPHCVAARQMELFS